MGFAGAAALREELSRGTPPPRRLERRGPAVPAVCTLGFYTAEPALHRCGRGLLQPLDTPRVPMSSSENSGSAPGSACLRLSHHRFRPQAGGEEDTQGPHREEFPV